MEFDDTKWLEEQGIWQGSPDMAFELLVDELFDLISDELDFYLALYGGLDSFLDNNLTVSDLEMTLPDGKSTLVDAVRGTIQFINDTEGTHLDTRDEFIEGILVENPCIDDLVGALVDLFVEDDVYNSIAEKAAEEYNDEGVEEVPWVKGKTDEQKEAEESEDAYALPIPIDVITGAEVFREHAARNRTALRLRTLRSEVVSMRNRIRELESTGGELEHAYSSVLSTYRVEMVREKLKSFKEGVRSIWVQ